MIVENNLLSNLTNEQKIDILRKNWQSHDARWQFATFKKIGPKKSNKLNQDVVRGMGKVMMHRLMKGLGILKVNNIKEFESISSAAMDLFFSPSQFHYKFKKVSDSLIMGYIEKCNTNNNIKRVGMEKLYECGCFALRSGWYDAFGVDVEEKCFKCLKDGDEICEIAIHIKWKK